MSIHFDLEDHRFYSYLHKNRLFRLENFVSEDDEAKNQGKMSFFVYPRFV